MCAIILAWQQSGEGGGGGGVAKIRLDRNVGGAPFAARAPLMAALSEEVSELVGLSVGCLWEWHCVLGG